MQKPCFRKQYTNPNPPSSNATVRKNNRGISVQRPPKVVSVPVRRVYKISKSKAAKRIQKAFRGFLVRRNVNKIAGIKKQVDEMETKLSLEETVDLIRKDAKERLKVNESLMSLLLRLDSVHSFDSGVRDLRKSVIKKVIVLQEKLDAIISRGKDLNREMEEVAKEEAVDGSIEKIKYPIKPTQNRNDPNCAEKMEGEGDKEESCGVAEQDEAQKEASLETVADGGMEMEQQPDLIQGKTEEKVGGDERKLEVMEKNDILIGMVRELCDKNKMQTEVINSLLKRVDDLEKDFKRFILVKENRANNSCWV